MQSTCNQHAIGLQSACNQYPLSTPTCPSDEGGNQLAISMQSVSLEHAHTCPLRSAAPLSPRSLTYLMREAISMQLACNQHAIIPLEPAQLDVPVDGQRHQNAVRSTT